MSVSSGISQSEVFECISPYKYRKGFLSVKLRANSNQIHNQTLSSAKDCGNQHCGTCLLSLFHYSSFQRDSVNISFRLIQEPSRWTTFPLTQKLLRRDKGCKGIKPGDCQDKRRKVRSQGILNYTRKKNLDEGHYRHMCLMNHKWNKPEYVIPGRQQNERATFQVQTKPNQSGLCFLRCFGFFFFFPMEAQRTLLQGARARSGSLSGWAGHPREAQARKLGAGVCTDMATNHLQCVLGAKGKGNLGWCSSLTKQSLCLTCLYIEVQVNQGQDIKIYILSVLWAARSY